ncbi:hypothetical protein HCN44_000456 [Aphidius gifuensis]|uniref:Uncharacterized protein n=1 Tax=Aphidius gifuensis TaxID=684658 RepID=A0A834XR17_APHGI|nr:hypothetical protein HCN44_000456 [Aphidius gifuensis]
MIYNEITVDDPVIENEIPSDEVMIYNEITVDDPVVENEIPTGEVMIYNEITVDETVQANNNETPVDGPGVENEIPVDVEKNDMANTDRKYETAAELFANAELEIKENEPVDEELDKFLGDLVQNALEANGLGEKIYSEIKKLAITSVKILPPTKRITMNSKKITAVDDDEERSKDGNTEKEDPVLPIRSGKHGKKIIAVDDDEDDVVILSQSSTSSSSSSSSGSSSSSSSSGPPPIMNENNVAEKYDKKNKYRAEAGSSKPKNDSVDITDFCVDCEGYQCPNKAATPYRQFCKGCHEKWQMGEQPHIPQPSPIPNPIFEKRQQLVDDKIKCLQNQIHELEESLNKTKCDLCWGKPII